MTEIELASFDTSLGRDVVYSIVQEEGVFMHRSSIFNFEKSCSTGV